MPPLPVVGYVRSPWPDAPKHDAAVDVIEDYARRHGMDLVCIYRDDGAPSTGSRRTGFIQAIARLRARHARALIVPASFHLSWDAGLRDVLTTLIHNAGGRLHVATAAFPELLAVQARRGTPDDCSNSTEQRAGPR